MPVNPRDEAVRAQRDKHAVALRRAGYVVLPPPRALRRRRCVKWEAPDGEWTCSTLAHSFTWLELDEGYVCTAGGRFGRIVDCEELPVPALSLGDATGDLELLEERSIDAADETHFGQWEDQFIAAHPGAEELWDELWLAFCRWYMSNEHYRIASGDGPPRPTPGLLTAIYVDRPPPVCPACGGPVEEASDLAAKHVERAISLRSCPTCVFTFVEYSETRSGKDES